MTVAILNVALVVASKAGSLWRWTQECVGLNLRFWLRRRQNPADRWMPMMLSTFQRRWPITDALLCEFGTFRQQGGRSKRRTQICTTQLLHSTEMWAVNYTGLTQKRPEPCCIYSPLEAVSALLKYYPPLQDIVPNKRNWNYCMRKHEM